MMKIASALLGAFLSLASNCGPCYAEPIPSSICPSCIQNSGAPQNAQINIGTETVRGTITASTITVNNLNVSTLTVNSLGGNGSALTNLNASNLASGTVPNARLSGTYSGVTGVSTVTTGLWQAQRVGTTYGGTGQNWGVVVQGSLPYFNATGTMTTLSPGSAGAVLQTNGGGANPAWTSAPSISGVNFTNINVASLGSGNMPQTVAVNDSSISTVTASKVIGNISGNAAGLTANLPQNKLSTGTLPTTIPASSITVTGVAPGTYGGPSQLAQIQVRSDGRIQSASQSTLSIAAGDVGAGTLGASVVVPAANIASGKLGAAVQASSVAATGVLPATYGSGSKVVQFTVAADGRVTSASDFSLPGVSTATVFSNVDNNWSHAQTSKSSWTIHGNLAAQQITISSAIISAGGNARGVSATDLQVSRGADVEVASGDYAVISGGQNNIADGIFSTVGGGANNSADIQGTVAGGNSNTAGSGGTVGGGTTNIASGSNATIAGGGTNSASQSGSTVGGGTNNISSGLVATIAGGDQGTASGEEAFIGGGSKNQALGGTDVVAGGNNNVASGSSSSVGGGDGNTAIGDFSTIAGGQGNTATGPYSFAAGRSAISNVTGAFTWADSQGGSLINNSTDQFLVRAQGGVQLKTSSFTITGPGGRLLSVDGSSVSLTIPVYTSTNIVTVGTGPYIQMNFLGTRLQNDTTGNLSITANAYWDPISKHWYRQNPSLYSFRIEIQSTGTIPGEINTQGINFWRATPGANPILDTYGAAGGWEIVFVCTQFRDCVIGGQALEMDGAGLSPYLRMTHSQPSATVLSGISRNLFDDHVSKDSPSQPSWFAGFAGDAFHIDHATATAGAIVTTILSVDPTGSILPTTNASIVLGGPTGNITTTSSVTANAFFGNGGALTGIVASGGLPLVGGTMTGQLTMAGSSITIVDSVATDTFSFLVTTATNRGVYHLAVTTTGRVGIWTSNPVSTFDVVGSAMFGKGATRSTFTTTGSLLLDANAQFLMGLGDSALAGLGVSTAFSKLDVFVSNTAGIKAINVLSNDPTHDTALFTSSTTASTVHIVARGNVGTNDAGPAPLFVDCSGAQGGICVNIYSSGANTQGLGSMLRVHNSNSASNQPMVIFQSDSTLFPASNLMLRGGIPSLYFWDNTRPAPYGQFQFSSHNDTLREEYRFDDNTAFDSARVVYRSTGGAHGATSMLFANGYQANNTRAYIEMRTNAYTTPTSYAVMFSSQNGTGLMVVQNNGNVGVGTSNPAATVHMSSGTLLIDGNNSVAMQTSGSAAYFAKGCISAATLRTTAPSSVSQDSNHVVEVSNCTDFDLYTSTGSGTGQWRNTRTGLGP